MESCGNSADRAASTPLVGPTLRAGGSDGRKAAPRFLGHRPVGLQLDYGGLTTPAGQLAGVFVLVAVAELAGGVGESPARIRVCAPAGTGSRLPLAPGSWAASSATHVQRSEFTLINQVVDVLLAALEFGSDLGNSKHGLAGRKFEAWRADRVLVGKACRHRSHVTPFGCRSITGGLTRSSGSDRLGAGEGKLGRAWTDARLPARCAGGCPHKPG